MIVCDFEVEPGLIGYLEELGPDPNKNNVSRLTILDPTKEHQKSRDLCALGLMTKAPEPGKVKTRLCPPLTPEEAAELNACFLRDLSSSIASATESCAAKGIGVYTPIGMETLYDSILPPTFSLLPQRGQSFDARLTSAIEDLLRIGFGSVCLINSDSPTVPPASFVEAVRALSEPGDRMVLGPAEDGGYFLIGVKKLHRRLFEEIDWSTERVFQQTMKRAREINLEVHELPRGLDVDDEQSLSLLCQELLQSSETTLDVAPNTRRFLQEIRFLR